MFSRPPFSGIQNHHNLRQYKHFKACFRELAFYQVFAYRAENLLYPCNVNQACKAYLEVPTRPGGAPGQHTERTTRARKFKMGFGSRAEAVCPMALKIARRPAEPGRLPDRTTEPELDDGDRFPEEVL